MAAVIPKKETKWADLDNEDEVQGTARTVDSVRSVVEYSTNEYGQRTKITKKLKTVQKSVKYNKSVLDRKKWTKFGLCQGQPAGPEPSITVVATNELVQLDLRPKKRGEEAEENVLEKLAANPSVCSNCGQPGHWTIKCPKRALLGLTPSSSKLGDDDSKDDKKDSGSSISGKYVAPRRETTEDKYGDQPTLLVSNVSEDATEADLGDLFKYFGMCSRIFLAKDKNTGRSRGFAFVTFVKKQDAERAMAKLNGYGYDNLILKVEWAQNKSKD